MQPLLLLRVDASAKLIIRFSSKEGLYRTMLLSARANTQKMAKQTWRNISVASIYDKM